MYLARRFAGTHIHYVLRESYLDGPVRRHRDLLELGVDPRQYILYGDGRSFALDDWVAEGLREKGVEVDSFELEKLFHPFVRPDVLSSTGRFDDRARHRNWRPPSAATGQKILAQTHPFDRRRAHFLRFGQVDQRQMLRSVSLYRKLLDKSRDEIEQDFLGQEMALQPHEHKMYIYTIFNLQAFFTQSFSLSMPEALDADTMDRHFLDMICELDSDEDFWKGFARGENLHEYLVRYVVMYFDSSFATRSGWEQYIRNFMDSHRRHAPPGASGRMSMNEAATVFGVSRAELAAMSLRELKGLFREKARELHPDKGGDHEAFIKLAAAYQEYSRIKEGK